MCSKLGLFSFCCGGDGEEDGYTQLPTDAEHITQLPTNAENVSSARASQVPYPTYPTNAVTSLVIAEVTRALALECELSSETPDASSPESNPNPTPSPGVIIVDVGSHNCKCGLSSDKQEEKQQQEGQQNSKPRESFPAVVGIPKIRQSIILDSSKQKSFFVGDEAVSKRGIMKLHYPVHKGLVSNWEDMERIWQYAFYSKLKVEPSEYPLLLIESPLNPRANRERMMRIMFEKFNVKCMYIATSALLALFASGRTSGLVVESGDSQTYSVPIYKGYSIHHNIVKHEYGGKDVNDYLRHILTERGYSFTSNGELQSLNEIKEKLCFVCVEPVDDNKLSSAGEDVSFELPDGNHVVLNDERYRCTEILFEPLNNASGVHEMAYFSIKKCDASIQSELCSNVVLSGGCTMFPGFAQRFTVELEALLESTDIKLMVTALEDRNHLSFAGAIMLANMPSFEKLLISRGDFGRAGAAIVHDKCLL